MSVTVKVLIALAVLVVLHFAVWNLRNDIADGEGLTKKTIIKLIAFGGVFVAGIAACIIFMPK